METGNLGAAPQLIILRQPAHMGKGLVVPPTLATVLDLRFVERPKNASPQAVRATPAQARARLPGFLLSIRDGEGERPNRLAGASVRFPGNQLPGTVNIPMVEMCAAARTGWRVPMPDWSETGYPGGWGVSRRRDAAAE